MFVPAPGLRDLSSFELWERSLARSRRRRAMDAARRRHKVTGAQVSAALLAATLTTPASVAHAQRTTAATTVDTGYLKLHSAGARVAAAQRALGIAADGAFGRQTRRAVRQFQRAHGLEVDGVVGPVTSAALGLSAPGGATSLKGEAQGPTPPAATTSAVQRALGLAADGEYGPITRAAVRGYQAAHGLEVDGVVGPATLSALGIAGAPTTAGGGSAVSAAASQIGVRYVLGGTSSSGWDCSGLTQWAMAQAGISLPRTSYSQFGAGAPVSRANVAAGDLVFFNTDGSGASHVGVATGNASVISATTHGVMEHPIDGDYWGAHYVGARRVG